MFSKDEKTLYILPPKYPGTTYTVPKGVEAIADYGIYSCRNLASLTLPEGLKSIGAYGISDCQNTQFTELYIPDTVTKIGE